VDQRKTLQQLQADPTFKQLQTQLQKHIELAADLIIEKALAHQDKPKQYPLPANANAPEAKMARILDKFGPLRRRKIRKAFEDRVGNRDKERDAHFGALAGVDPRKPVAIIDQIRPLLSKSLTKPPAAQVQALVKKLEAIAPQPRATPRGTPPGRLVLELTRIKCVEKTREFLEGRDEIELNALPQREQDFRPDASPAPPVRLDLGKFKEGQESTTPREVVSFPLNAATTFPQGFGAFLLLTEADALDPNKSGGLVAFLLVMFYALAQATLAALILLVPAVAAIPWIGIAFLILLGIGLTSPLWIRRLLDDPFEFTNESVILASAADVLPDVRTVTVDIAPTDFDLYEGVIPRRGRYTMDFQWKFA
jgi:hypothetical protein